MKTLRIKPDDAKRIIEEHAITDLLKNKTFYSLTDFVKEYEICDDELVMKSAIKVREKLNSLSFPARYSFQIHITKDGKVKNIYANSLGLMLTLCEISKNIKDNLKAKFCTNLAQYIKMSTKIFYPEQRCLLRLEYTETTKNFRNKLNYILKNRYGYGSISSEISLFYNEMIQGYYHKNKENINEIKSGNYSNIYLDYISCRELKDLIEIHKAAINALDTSVGDAKIATRRKAEERRLNFYTHFAGQYPEEYRAHKLKPAKMLKEFDKVLKEYKLDSESVNEFNLTK